MNKKTITYIIIAVLLVLVIWKWDYIMSLFLGSGTEGERTACFRKCYTSYTNAGYTANQASGICNGHCAGAGTIA